MADEPRLNSLARSRKQPQRLVLEEHGHCEVPAGCGGVVLRWRNPRATLTVTLYLYTPVEAECRLDGAALRTGHIDLSPGRHVLTVALADVSRSGPLLMFAAAHDPKDFQHLRPAAVAERPFKLVSKADGSWKCTLKPPPEGWAAPGFDDGGWPALGKVATPTLTWQDHNSWQCHECTRRGAVCLGLVAPTGKKQRAWWQRALGVGEAGTLADRGSLWARKLFDIPDPEEVTPPRAE
jgi:hypothetical protein